MTKNNEKMAKGKNNKDDGREKEVPDPNEPSIPFYDTTLFLTIGFEWILLALGFIFFCLNGAYDLFILFF